MLNEKKVMNILQMQTDTHAGTNVPTIKKLFIKSILDDFANEPSIHQEKVLIGQLSYSAYKSRLNVCVS